MESNHHVLLREVTGRVENAPPSGLVRHHVVLQRAPWGGPTRQPPSSSTCPLGQSESDTIGRQAGCLGPRDVIPRRAGCPAMGPVHSPKQPLPGTWSSRVIGELGYSGTTVYGPEHPLSELGLLGPRGDIPCFGLGSQRPPVPVSPTVGLQTGTGRV